MWQLKDQAIQEVATVKEDEEGNEKGGGRRRHGGTHLVMKKLLQERDELRWDMFGLLYEIKGSRRQGFGLLRPGHLQQFTTGSHDNHSVPSPPVESRTDDLSLFAVVIDNGGHHACMHGY